MQRICGVDSHRPNLESGEEFQEETFPSRAGESFGDSFNSMAPAHSTHTNLLFPNKGMGRKGSTVSPGSLETTKQAWDAANVILCRPFLSAAEQAGYQIVMHYTRTFSIEEQ